MKPNGPPAVPPATRARPGTTGAPSGPARSPAAPARPREDSVEFSEGGLARLRGQGNPSPAAEHASGRQATDIALGSMVPAHALAREGHDPVAIATARLRAGRYAVPEVTAVVVQRILASGDLAPDDQGSR